MSVTALPAVQLPPYLTVDYDTLALSVRAYLLGERREAVMELLRLTHHRDFSALLTHPAWMALQHQFRDEYVDRVQGRLTRIESTILDGVEDALENGITAHNMMGDAYHRKLTINEKMKIWQLLQDSQKQLAKAQAAKQVTPQLFDRRAKMEELAKFSKAQLIEAAPEAQAASGD